jgi:hypothetical protein
MYDINFIGKNIVPESHRKVRTIVTSLASVALGLTFVAILTIVVADMRGAEVYAADVAKLDERISALYGMTPSEQDLGRIVSQTAPDLKEVSKLVDRRMLFSSLWQHVAAAVPEDVWLTRVCMSDPRTVKEETTTRNRTKSHSTFKGIVIEGVALAGSGPEGDQAVSLFLENLKNDTELSSKVLAFEFIGTGLQQVGGTSVVGFEISCPM